MADAIALDGLERRYGERVALTGVALRLEEGRTLTVLGANGAGKTTLLRALCGLLDVHDGEITKGSIRWQGERIDGKDPAEIVRSGITQVLEGRRIFAEMSVDENLQIGAYTAADRRSLSAARDRVMALFPILASRGRDTAGYLSGGEQQMLAIGRALMASPKLLILDEPSLGLAPLLVQQIRELIVEINKQGTTVLLVEQNAAMALAIADHGYVLETGKVVMDRPSAALLADSDVREFYLGLRTEGVTKSFRDVKHYKRRKRWLS